MLKQFSDAQTWRVEPGEMITLSVLTVSGNGFKKFCELIVTREHLLETLSDEDEVE